MALKPTSASSVPGHCAASGHCPVTLDTDSSSNGLVSILKALCTGSRYPFHSPVVPVLMSEKKADDTSNQGFSR